MDITACSYDNSGSRENSAAITAPHSLTTVKSTFFFSISAWLVTRASLVLRLYRLRVDLDSWCCRQLFHKTSGHDFTMLIDMLQLRLEHRERPKYRAHHGIMSPLGLGTTSLDVSVSTNHDS